MRTLRSGKRKGPARRRLRWSIAIVETCQRSEDPQWRDCTTRDLGGNPKRAVKTIKVRCVLQVVWLPVYLAPRPTG